MSSKARYWDSNVWLGLLNNEADKVDACKEQLERARQGQFKVICSAITLTEVVWLRGPDRQKLPPSVNPQIEAFFKHDFISVRPVDRAIGEKARRLVWEFADSPEKLKPYDAVHVATAVMLNIPILHTYDPDLLQLHGLVAFANGEKLEIVRPPAPSMGDLFDTVLN